MADKAALGPGSHQVQSVANQPPDEPVQYTYTFPPFPARPDGVRIIPFTDYKEYGIRKSQENEFDGMGIRTVALTSQENRTKKSNKVQKSNINNSKIQWWEHWEEGEKQRSTGPFLKDMSDTEKLGQAASEFKMGRPWPLVHTTRVEYLWDQFLLFIGLTGLTSNSKINKSTTYKNEEIDEDPSDEEAESAIDQESLKRRSGEKLSTFVNDPETVFKAFLSSHMWSSGLVWTDQHLDTAPRLLSFFARFLIRNKVMVTQEEALNRSLDVILIALKELPLTSKLSKACPDKFSVCCAGSWNHTNEPKAVIIDINMGNNAGPDISSASLQDLALNDQDDWYSTDTDNLSQYPGATASLIDTHMPGLVEMSTRRIKSIVPPSEPDAVSTAAKNPRAEDIEADLNQHFAKIILSPWANWDTKEYPEFATPKIVGGLDQKDSAIHDPLKDDIVLLAEESLIESLGVGMGIAGRWVQLAKKATSNMNSQDQAEIKAQNATYWFMDAMKLVIPSFWVPTPDSLAI